MLFWLSELSDGGDVFNLFRYITFRTGGAFFTALIFGFIFGRPLINALRRKYKDGQPIREVGPGGHYLGHPHTQENFQQAFFMPELFDNNSIEQWIADGSKEINERALEKVQALLDAYEEPTLDPGIDEALRDYITRREREIPAVDALNDEY